jgi:hypothetical protein
MIRMLTITSILIMILLNSIPVSGQEVKSDTSAMASFPHGKWGLQAQLGNPFLHNNKPPLFMIIKYRTNEKNAWRLGCSVDGDFRKDSNKVTSIYIIDTLGTADTTMSSDVNKNHLQDFDIFAQRIYYLAPSKMTTFYWGLGPEFEFTRSWQALETYNNQYDTGHSSEWVSTYISAGLNGVIGAEYYPLNKIGITFEYSIKTMYSHGSAENKYSSSNSTIKRDEFSFYNSRAEFGITVYF